MYQIKIYAGGLYKFKDFKEFVEDLGGLILKKDSFHISRGEYFLSDEIRVLTIIPHHDEKITKKMAKNIKGHLENPNITFEDEIKILSFIPVHDCLSQFDYWMSKEDLKKRIKCPCQSSICKISPYCFKENLGEILEIMVKMEIINKCIDEKEVKYKLKTS